MKVAQISKPGGAFELSSGDIPEPGEGQVRVKVEACGICHSDSLVKEGLWPDCNTRECRHEVAGKIDALGDGVTKLEKGSARRRRLARWTRFRVRRMPRGDFMMCVNRKINRDRLRRRLCRIHDRAGGSTGGNSDALPAEKRGRSCARASLFTNALRNSGARVGDLVAVHGIGGLDISAFQLRAQMGLIPSRWVAEKIRKNWRRNWARIATLTPITTTLSPNCKSLGGARVILGHGPNAKAILDWWMDYGERNVVGPAAQQIR